VPGFDIIDLDDVEHQRRLNITPEFAKDRKEEEWGAIIFLNTIFFYGVNFPEDRSEEVIAHELIHHVLVDLDKRGPRTSIELDGLERRPYPRDPAEHELKPIAKREIAYWEGW
jgi:hypothetical protein